MLMQKAVWLKTDTQFQGTPTKFTTEGATILRAIQADKQSFIIDMNRSGSSHINYYEK
jgi:hypothetical protein